MSTDFRWFINEDEDRDATYDVICK